MFHLRAVLAGADKQAIGGHLDSAIIEVAREIAFYTASAISRQQNGTTDLLWLDLADSTRH